MELFIALIFILETGALLTLFFLYQKKVRAVRKLSANIGQTRESLDERISSTQDERNRIFAILESMVEGVVVIDTQKKILSINTVLTRAFDLPKERLHGKYFWEVFRDPEINGMIEKALKERVSIEKEHPVLLSGTTFQIQISPVFGGKDFLGLVAVFHDVTRLKKLEQSRSEFVANVSHELKTPLTSIMGFVETLKEGAVEDSENRGKFLDIIDEHSKKLNHLIEELLFLSKIESERGRVIKEDIDIHGLLTNVIGLFSKPLKAKAIKVQMDVQPKPLFVKIDPKTFDQALSNLVDNAIKYNQRDGEIFIRTAKKNGNLSIQIRDTGIGIPKDDLPHVFERFYRVDKSRSRESGGTGLGLAITKHIVERHGGDIQASSTPNQGTTFTITLPV